MSKRHLFVLFAIFIGLTIFLFPKNHQGVFHSSSSAKLMCSELFCSQTFDHELFQKKVVEWTIKVPEKIELSSLKGEEFLAYLEVTSKREQFEGLDLEDWLASANDKELKKILQISNNVITSETLTEYQLRGLVRKIYKTVHYKKLSFLNPFARLDIAEAIRNVKDSYIDERIELVLIQNNIAEAIQNVGLITSPNTIDKFKSYLRAKKSAVWKLIAVLFAVPAIIHGQLPPFLPGADYVNSAVKANPQWADEVIQQGYRAMLPILRERLRNRTNIQLIQNFSLRVFNVVSSLLLVAFIQHQSGEVQAARAQQAQNSFNEMTSVVEKESQRAMLTPDQMADELLDKFLNGQKVETQNIDGLRNLFRGAFRDVAAP